MPPLSVCMLDGHPLQAPRMCTRHVLQAAGGKGSSESGSVRSRLAAAAGPLARACSGCQWGGAGQGQERAWSGGTLCLARPTLRTGGSGAQGLWSVIHSQTTSEPLPKGDGPARPL